MRTLNTFDLSPAPRNKKGTSMERTSRTCGHLPFPMTKTGILHGIGGVPPAVWIGRMAAYYSTRGTPMMAGTQIWVISIVTWIYRVRNDILSGDLPQIYLKIRKRGLGQEGHCMQHPELAARGLILW